MFWMFLNHFIQEGYWLVSLTGYFIVIKVLKGANVDRHIKNKKHLYSETLQNENCQ